LRALLLDDRRHRFRVIAVKPCQGGIAFDGGGSHVLFGERFFRLALETARAQAALVGPRELLRHADPAHRHEIAGQAVPVSAADGQVVDAELEDRIRKLPGGDRHVARSGNGIVLGGELARTLDGERTGLRQGERRLGAGHAVRKRERANEHGAGDPFGKPKDGWSRRKRRCRQG
jgi:hypothetical protein